MTPKEIVLNGYNFFAKGDMESLGKIFHQDALISVNGDHQLSGEYHGFGDWLNNFVMHLPIKFPNFAVDIVNVVAEGDRVHVTVRYTADNLDAVSVHMFTVKDGLQTEFQIFDDSQKISNALSSSEGT